MMSIQNTCKNTQGTLFKDLWGKVKKEGEKATHSAGIKPMTSEPWGMRSTATLQPMPQAYWADNRIKFVTIWIGQPLSQAL